jgi:hypothetical protein
VKKFAIIPLIVVFLTSSLPSASAANWEPLTHNDYIFGYESSKYSCWSNPSSENPPTLEVYENGKWLKVATGIALSADAPLSVPCGSDYPKAILYKWTVMNPQPPSNSTNRYTVLARERIPDFVTTKSVWTTESVEEEEEKCCRKTTTYKNVPYISSSIVKGKKVNVIKYKKVASTKNVKYTVTKYVDKEVENIVETNNTGFVGSNFNISVYPSVSAMNKSYSDLGDKVLCSFGYTVHCKK